MEDDLGSNIGFIMGNKQRERIVQVLGSKGRMPSEKIAKFEHIPLPSAKRILEELAARNGQAVGLARARRSTLAALEAVLPRLETRGFRVVPASQAAR